MSAPDTHVDAAALALGALPGRERPTAQAHIDTCDSCRAELVGFRETVSRLAAVAAETPPAALRRSVLAAVAVTPQLPILDVPAPSTSEPVSDATSALPSPAPTDDAAGPARDTLPVSGRRRSPWYRRPGALIAAAVAAVVIVGAAVVITQFRGQQQVAQTPEQCVSSAADQVRVSPASGQGEVVYAVSCGAVTVDVSGLPALPDDRTYQLWALSNAPQSPPRSLGLLPQVADGQPQVVTEPMQLSDTQMAITTEPAGGSAAPTFPVVWMADLGS